MKEELKKALELLKNDADMFVDQMHRDNIFTSEKAMAKINQHANALALIETALSTAQDFRKRAESYLEMFQEHLAIDNKYFDADGAVLHDLIINFLTDLLGGK